MDRRNFMKTSLMAGISLMAAGWLWRSASAASDKAERFEVTMSDEEWKNKLNPEQYRVLREEGTERAFTSPLNDEHREGIFKCAGCGQELFSSDAKFESGSGWPSFFQPLTDKSVGSSTDYKIGYPRTEVHCAKCGGHLGHVFDDGPKPTGKRFCMNGVAMTFAPEEK